MTQKKSVPIALSILLAPALLSPVFSQSKWEETFDTTEIPEGWRTINNDGSPSSAETSGTFDYVELVEFVDDNGAVVDQVGPQTGARFWFSDFENANASGLIDEWLISPKIAGIASGDFLSFYAGAPDGEFDDSLRVFVSTADSSLASFTNQIDYFKVAGATDDYAEYTFDLSAFAGLDIFVAVNYHIVDGGPNGNHSDSVWLDHFSVSSTVTGVSGPSSRIDRFALQQNYPNPFNPSTEIVFQLGFQTEVTLVIYNLLGQEVAVLLDEKPFVAGAHSVSFEPTNLAAGVYYYRLTAGDFTDLKRMTLLK